MFQSRDMQRGFRGCEDKMKVVQINTFPTKATGHIMMNIHKILTDSGYDSYVCWGRGRDSSNDHEIVISDRVGVKYHGIYTRIFDKTGFASKRATWKLLNRLNEIEPDIIHLHNIHGYYLNIEMLFNYIRQHKIKTIWTLHDCWALTGHCAWFDVCGCDKWKTGCNNCKQSNTYPTSKVLDNSKWNWEKKKALFSDLDITIVTPSKWLAGLVKESYLKNYPVIVINNGIDLGIFKPTLSTGVREKYGLDNRPIILGVASEWTPRKGLNDIIRLSEMLKNIQFVVVGLTEKQFQKIPKTVKGIKRTESQSELVELYSMAEIFFNPTYEDNFPTTNIEALACGTPVITYDTGGSPEILDDIKDKMIGKVIKKRDAKSVDMEKVKKIVNDTIDEIQKYGKNVITENCKVVAQNYDKDKKMIEYLSVYEDGRIIL